MIDRRGGGKTKGKSEDHISYLYPCPFAQKKFPLARRDEKGRKAEARSFEKRGHGGLETLLGGSLFPIIVGKGRASLRH